MYLENAGQKFVFYFASLLRIINRLNITHIVKALKNQNRVNIN